ADAGCCARPSLARKPATASRATSRKIRTFEYPRITSTSFQSWHGPPARVSLFAGKHGLAVRATSPLLLLRQIGRENDLKPPAILLGDLAKHLLAHLSVGVRGQGVEEGNRIDFRLLLRVEPAA